MINPINSSFIQAATNTSLKGIAAVEMTITEASEICKGAD